VKRPRGDEFTMAHDQRIEQLKMFSGWSKPNSLSFPLCLSANQPLSGRETSLRCSIYLEHIVIPDDKLEDAKLVDER